MRTSKAFAFVIGLALTAAACGGGADDDAAAENDAAAESEVTTGDAGTAPADDAPADDAPAGGCADEAALNESFDVLNDDGRTADEKRASMQAALDYFDRTADSAPADLAEDFELVSGYFEALFNVLEKIDFDPNNLATDADVASEFAGLTSQFDPSKLPVALGNVSRYISENCE